MEYSHYVLQLGQWVMNHPFYSFSFPVTMMIGSKFLPIRVGIGRSIIVGLRSRIQNVEVVSDRKNDVVNIRTVINYPIKHGSFAIVSGAKGIGKTVAINTALIHRCGVVKMEVYAGATASSIVNAVLDEVSGIPYSFVNKSPSTHRVARWHARFFRIPITVVLQAAEVQKDKTYAELVPAARRLTNLGLKVVIDASDNSINPAGKLSLRENIVAMEPMSRSQIESIDELTDVIKALENEKLLDVVWNCCGGVPQHYFNGIKIVWDDRPGQNIRTIALGYCMQEIDNAIVTYTDFLLTYPEQGKLLSEFRNHQQIHIHDIKDKQYPNIPTPNKVFRKIRTESKQTIIVPASNAMALVLKYQWKKTPSEDELLRLFPQSTTEKKNVMK